MFKRVNPFPFLLLSAALVGCNDDSGTSNTKTVYAANSQSETGSKRTPEVSREGIERAEQPGQVGTSSSIEAHVLPATPPLEIPVATLADSSVADAPDEGAALLAVTDDHFVVKADEDKDLSVSVNDSFVEGETRFEVVQYPGEGELVMEPNGSFIYYPNNDFTGLDTFVYAARQGSSVQQATASIDVLPNENATGQGFTPIKPSADSKIIYVSSSQGDDSNDCESATAPCQSLQAALSKTRAGSPDHVYLKRGDVWRDEKLSGLNSGRSIKEPAVIAFYGSGARPKIEHSDNIVTVSNESMAVKNLHIIGLHFDAYKMAPESESFTGTNEDHAGLVFLTNNENVLLEDNLFNYMEIVIQEFNNQQPKNFTLRRNIWTGAYGDTSSYSQKKRPSNIYAAGVDGLVIEENVFDYGGWNPEANGAAGNMYNHNLYLQSSNNGERVVVRNNIITRGSSHGVQMRAGGLAEDNFFGRNAIGLLIGYGEKPLKTGVKAHAINNVITEGTSMVKGDQPCSGENLCTPAQWGLHFLVNGDADWLAKGNIVHSIEENDRTWEGEYDGLVTKAFKGLDDPTVVAIDNHQSSWGSEVLEGVTESDERVLTLGDYYLELLNTGAVTEEQVGEDEFDKFMNLVKARGIQQWDEKLTAKAINSYIRAGFKKS